MNILVAGEWLLALRRRGTLYKTFAGWIIFGIMGIVLFFGVNERRYKDDEETALRKEKITRITRIVALVLFVASIIVDAMVYDAYYRPAFGRY